MWRSVVTNRWVLLVFTMVIIVLAGVALERRASEREYQQRLEFCQDVEAIRTYARDAADRALKSLPTIRYYKMNPDELDNALDEVRRQRSSFSPARDCKTFAHGLR